MKAYLLPLALASAVLVPVTSALAADLDPPPPIEDLRPSTYDWTGVSIGVFGAANAVQGRYNANQICDDPTTPAVETCFNDPEMSGIGYGFGVKLGADYQFDNLVIGVVGDWTFGDQLADNDDPVEATYLNMPNFATLRGRVGWADDRTLIYATAGLAAAEMEFGALIGPLPSVNDSKAEWTYGYAIGGGIEHAITDSLSVGLEYLYVDLQNTSHFLSDGMGIQGTVDMIYEDMHTVRASLNYRFSL